MTQELWAIKSPWGQTYLTDECYSESYAWDSLCERLGMFREVDLEKLKQEGYRAVRVRVEEIEGNESDDSKGGE